jgi:hypothetical protein
MRKYLAAAALGAMLMAGQAAAYDSSVVGVGDRVAAQSATADGLEGSNGALYFALAALLVIGVVSWAATSTKSGTPASP